MESPEFAKGYWLFFPEENMHVPRQLLKQKGALRMSRFDITVFYQSYIAMLNGRQFHRIAEFLHDPVEVRGKMYDRSEVLAAWVALTRAVPDFAWRVDETIVEEGRIAVRLHDTGTLAEPWLGNNEIGAKLSFTEFAFYEVQNGRFSRMWAAFDAQTVGLG